MLALSFERIHRSNLIGMGILPLRLPADFDADRLKLRPGDIVRIDASPQRITPRGRVPVTIRKVNEGSLIFEASVAVETSVEIETLGAGGVPQLILNRVLKQHEARQSPAIP